MSDLVDQATSLLDLLNKSKLFHVLITFRDQHEGREFIFSATSREGAEKICRLLTPSDQDFYCQELQNFQELSIKKQGIL